MNILLYPILLPIAAGLAVLLIKKAGKFISVLISAAVIFFSFVIFSAGEIGYSVPWLTFGIDFSLRAYAFSSFCVLFSSLFTLLICLYSTNYGLRSKNYFSLILINLGVVNGAFFADNFVVFVLFWEIVAVLLYLLIKTGAAESYKTATKALYIIGFSDFCLLLGVVLLWSATGSFKIFAGHLPLNSYGLLAFSLMTIGALAKAGAMPFHTWIPDAAKDTSPMIMAYLPASIDKLLGIYLLARICTDFFDFNFNFSINIVLMFIGVFTIIAAVMMALVQHDLKKLLSYHAVSQVGYMVLGIGTGTAVGIYGGIFHMLNHSIYKSCLFLCSGSVEKQAGSADLEKLGGLSKAMPLTFISTLIAALSISGVPPFNGFFSKWMIYQGLIQKFSSSGYGPAVMLFLAVAMLSSALTLASFIKVIHSVFLGQSRRDVRLPRVTEVSWTMWLPTVILAFLCVLFGIFAYQIPLKYFIIPALPAFNFPLPAGFSGIWQPSLATLLIVVGIILGFIVYLFGTIKNIRRAPSYTYGEDPEIFREGFPGTEFYLTVSEARPFALIYEKAAAGFFDFYLWAMSVVKFFSYFIRFFIDRFFEFIYSAVRNTVLAMSMFSSSLQGGLLSVYIFWSLTGFMVLLFILCR